MTEVGLEHQVVPAPVDAEADAQAQRPGREPVPALVQRGERHGTRRQQQHAQPVVGQEEDVVRAGAECGYEEEHPDDEQRRGRVPAPGDPGEQRPDQRRCDRADPPALPFTRFPANGWPARACRGRNRLVRPAGWRIVNSGAGRVGGG